MTEHVVRWVERPPETPGRGMVRRRLEGAGAGPVRVEIPAGVAAAAHPHPHEQFVEVIRAGGGEALGHAPLRGA